MRKLIENLSVILAGVGFLLLVKNLIVHLLKGESIFTFARDNYLVLVVSGSFVGAAYLLLLLLKL